jgi:hypothetical protein
MSLISSTMLSLDSVVSLNNVVPRIWAEVEKDSDGLGLYALTIASAPADVADRRFSEPCLIEAPIPEGVPSAEYEVALWTATTNAMMFALQLQMVLSSIGLHVAVYNVPTQATDTGISVLMPDKMPESVLSVVIVDPATSHLHPSPACLSLLGAFDYDMVVHPRLAEFSDFGGALFSQSPDDAGWANFPAGEWHTEVAYGPGFGNESFLSEMVYGIASWVSDCVADNMET